MAVGPSFIFVATEPDLCGTLQEFPEAPLDYCATRGLPAPVYAASIDSVLTLVADICLAPFAAPSAVVLPSLSTGYPSLQDICYPPFALFAPICNLCPHPLQEAIVLNFFHWCHWSIRPSYSSWDLPRFLLLN